MADLAMRASDDALLGRVLSKAVPGWGGCLIWTGTRTNGYGIIGVGGKTRGVHRVMYELAVGPIPEGAHLDHQCRVRCCVNPHHLEPVNAAENSRRTRGYRAGDQCHNGHDMRGVGVRVRPAATYPDSTAPRRECLSCWSELTVRRLFSTPANGAPTVALYYGRDASQPPLIKAVAGAPSESGASDILVNLGGTTVQLTGRASVEEFQAQLLVFAHALAALGARLPVIHPNDSDPDMDEALRRVRETGGVR